ncbi:MAG: hypothetical protein A2X67_01040 [Ignavibacteria bacterium GWA2_55_11]|nr:MAG: hypothetical protein A2X67_01040 [Ignavibacteria bacterium GWA2_55_11]OGU65346.1 MAG: hypothetical protein A3C56_01630 [Ignavibacteria bacterium RIFCSPHIGHO2_02_FULL_56_12]OGU70410.1 MAG: hypothetical protein A3H45_01520 [Ignavibacteria bacterium RIFCSPLOWO2_02_FULL_55_14]HAV23235.1 universal stress protein [Bacteroidota bacterium]
MHMPRRILIPTDMSDFSLSALQYAEEVAELFNASLTVVHIVEHEEHRSGLSDVERQQKAKSAIANLLMEKELVPRSISIVMRHGHAATEIVKAARELNADLIVMSTHGRTGMKHVLLGSVTEKVVRMSPCPVLTVRPEQFREVVGLTEEDVEGDLRLKHENGG